MSFNLMTTEARLLDMSNRNLFDPEERCPDTKSYARCIAACLDDDNIEFDLVASAIEDWLLTGMLPGNEGRTIKQMVDDYIDSNY